MKIVRFLILSRKFQDFEVNKCAVAYWLRNIGVNSLFLGHYRDCEYHGFIIIQKTLEAKILRFLTMAVLVQELRSVLKILKNEPLFVVECEVRTNMWLIISLKLLLREQKKNIDKGI